MDVEDAAHVVHGEDSEELPLHVGNGDGLHGELLLAHDGDFVRGRMEIPLTLFAEWCALADEDRGNKGGGQYVPLPETVSRRPCFPPLPPRCTRHSADDRRRNLHRNPRHCEQRNKGTH